MASISWRTLEQQPARSRFSINVNGYLQNSFVSWYPEPRAVLWAVGSPVQSGVVPSPPFQVLYFE